MCMECISKNLQSLLPYDTAEARNLKTQLENLKIVTESNALYLSAMRLEATFNPRVLSERLPELRTRMEHQFELERKIVGGMKEESERMLMMSHLIIRTPVAEA